jgi:uncharacterized protein YuzE
MADTFFLPISMPNRHAGTRLMRMTYDPAAEGMYLYLTERAAEAVKVARTEEVAPGLILDFDSDGRVIGIEMLSVSQVPGAKPMQMAFEILEPSDAAAAE